MLGCALTLTGPAVAHFSGSTSYRHDWGHVKPLQVATSTLNSQVSSLNSQVVKLRADCPPNSLLDPSSACGISCRSAVASPIVPSLIALPTERFEGNSLTADAELWDCWGS